MKNVLLLTQRMTLGFGVSVVVHELAVRLAAKGYRVSVGCQESDGSFTGYDTLIVTPDVSDVRRLARSLGNPVLVAETSPFFEIAAQLAHEFDVWAWEHGDPTPSLFPDNGAERERMRQHKIALCYPNMRQVVVISDFLRRDIGWPQATIIRNGCDHAPDRGPKTQVSAANEPLKIGTLMRLGAGEARYKGNDIFIKLCDELRHRGVAIAPHVMGRGTADDARAFTERGFSVVLNGSEAEKWDYLRNLDVFVSCSLWEGFNLPLVEAQAIGTLALAFDTGAHPEVCPWIASDLDDMATVIASLAADRARLVRESAVARSFVRDHFRWDDSAALFDQLLTASPARARPSAPPRLERLLRNPRLQLLRKTADALRNEGARGTVVRAVRYVRKRLN